MSGETGKAEQASDRELSPAKFIFRYLGRHKFGLAVALFWSVLYYVIPMQIPIVEGALINSLTNSTSHVGFYGFVEFSNSTSLKSPGFQGSTFVIPYTQERQIFSYMAVSFIVFAVAYGVAAYYRTNSIAKVSRHFISRLQRILVRKLEILSLDEHAKYGSGELLYRTMSDTQSLRPFIEDTIIKTIVNIIRTAYPLVVIFLLNPLLGVIASLVLPVQFLLTRKLQDSLRHASRGARRAKAAMTTILKENLDGIETIQVLHAEKSQVQRISEQIKKVEKRQIQSQMYSGVISSFVWTITGLGVALVWFVGGLEVISKTPPLPIPQAWWISMQVGTLVTVTILVAFAYDPIRYFTEVISTYQSSLIAAKEIQEVLDAAPSIRQVDNAPELVANEGRIELRNVSFSYGKKEALRNIYLTIEPRRLTVIVGKSGSGKSSILKLITRLYDPSRGEVTIDGQDLKQVKLESLRSQVAVVPQASVIFSGTVSENVRLGKTEATDDDVIEACRAAYALDFVSKLSDGFNTRLGEGGASLSGGQAQRIAIARALLRRPKILLLDEPSSALDPTSESAIIATLEEQKKDMTIVVVSHRPTSVQKADKVIVIDDGRVVEQGTQKELIDSPGAYALLYQHQGQDKQSVAMNEVELVQTAATTAEPGKKTDALIDALYAYARISGLRPNVTWKEILFHLSSEAGLSGTTAMEWARQVDSYLYGKQSPPPNAELSQEVYDSLDMMIKTRLTKNEQQQPPVSLTNVGQTSATAIDEEVAAQTRRCAICDSAHPILNWYRGRYFCNDCFGTRFLTILETISHPPSTKTRGTCEVCGGTFPKLIWHNTRLFCDNCYGESMPMVSQ